jgi:hypothetical protein
MSRRQADRRPIEVVPLDQPLPPATRYVQVVEAVPTKPAAAHTLDSLGRMPPSVAITLILSSVVVTGGMVVTALALVGIVVMALAAIVGMVSIGGIAVGLLALVLGGGKAQQQVRG